MNSFILSYLQNVTFIQSSTSWSKISSWSSWASLILLDDRGGGASSPTSTSISTGGREGSTSGSFTSSANFFLFLHEFIRASAGSHFCWICLGLTVGFRNRDVPAGRFGPTGFSRVEGCFWIDWWPYGWRGFRTLRCWSRPLLVDWPVAWCGVGGAITDLVQSLNINSKLLARSVTSYRIKGRLDTAGISI